MNSTGTVIDMDSKSLAASNENRLKLVFFVNCSVILQIVDGKIHLEISVF